MLRLRTIYRAENIGNVPNRVVNVCQREFVNEVPGPLVTEFVCNFGLEDARPMQHAFHGGLLDPMWAVNLLRHSAPQAFLRRISGLAGSASGLTSNFNF